MSYKVFNTEEVKMKKSFNAVVEAFEKFDNRGHRWSVPVPKRFSLGAKFDPVYSCDHDWFAGPVSEESKKFFQMKFEEADIGDEQKKCSKCGAYSLWESGRLFAYDAVPPSIDEKVSEAKPRRQNRK